MRSEVIVIPIIVEEKNDQFLINWSNSEVQYSSPDLQLIGIENLLMEKTDLYVQVNLNHPETGFYYDLSIQLETADQKLILPGPAEIAEVLARSAMAKTIIWKDLIEKRIELGFPYQLLIYVDLYGNACATVPEFTLADKIPHFGAYALGVGAIGAGFIFKRQADQAHAAYERAWASGENTASLESSREDFRTYRNLVYAGLGVITVNSIVYYFRKKNYKKAKKRFDRYCSPYPGNQKLLRLGAATDLGFSIRINF